MKKYIQLEVLSSSKEKLENGKYRFDYVKVSQKKMQDGTIKESTSIESANSLVPLEKGMAILEITDGVIRDQAKYYFTVIGTHKAISVK